MIGRDPIGYVAGPNLYEYVGGCPLHSMDPTGLMDLPKPDRSFLGPNGENKQYTREEYLKKLGIKEEGIVKKELDKGCVGLCALRQQNPPLDHKEELLKPNFFNKPVNRTKCYLSPESAKGRKCKDSTSPFIFAVLGTMKFGPAPPAKEDLEPDDPPDRVSNGAISVRQHWDYATYFPDNEGGFWENIQPGINKDNVPQVVTISKDVYISNAAFYPHIMYCTTCCEDKKP